MTTVKAIQNDTVELICHRHFGRTLGVTGQVYSINPGLAKHGLILPQGTEIQLPEIATEEEQKTVKLWE